MIGEGRRRRILELIDCEGMVRAADLGIMFGVTPATIRRDLEALEDEALIRRVHGGAVGVRGRGSESPFPLRSSRNEAAKRRIGWAAARLVANGESLALDVGTTALELARHLRAWRNLTIITHNLRAAVELVAQPSHRVLVSGGQLRADELSLTGHLAQRTHGEFFVDKLFLGAAGVSTPEGITEFNIEDALVKQGMLAQAKERILLADRSKFGHVALTRVCRLAEVHRLVTDAPPGHELAQALADAGVEVIVAPETLELGAAVEQSTA